MNKILFFAQTYWELQWLYNPIKALNAPIFSESPQVIDLANFFNFSITKNSDEFDVLVTCIYHMPENYKIISKFWDHQKHVILLQHAWDSQYQYEASFWGLPMDKFSLYIVGSSQDKKWLAKKHGQNITNLGMPKLDDLYQVSKDNHDLSKIYKQVGHDKFFLADFPSHQIYGHPVERAYLNLPNISPLPVVFKMHPGGNHQSGLQWQKQNNIQIIYLDDEKQNLTKTYQLIKASQGVIALESFLHIEASLLKTPVIFHAHDLLPKDFFSRNNSQLYPHRLHKAMSSTLQNPHFTPKQNEIASWYRFDGKNTQRVVKLLKQIQSLNL